MKEFIACFIPLFIAIDAIGILPTFLGITSDNSKLAKRHIVTQASITGIIVGTLFILLGRSLFHFLGISIPDFQVAGGVLLFVFAIKDLLDSSRERRNVPDPHIGIVPIGIPLIVGPGVLTSVLLLEAKYGFAMTSSALIANIAIVFLVFRYSDMVLKVIGKAGAVAIGKVFSIFLAAIGIMLIRRGLLEIIGNM